jgi:hypothetical protein
MSDILEIKDEIDNISLPSISVKSEPNKIISDDISLSQLEAMANIKKLKKENSNEISVSKLNSEKSKTKQRSTSRKYKSSSSFSEDTQTSSESTIQLDKKRARKIAKENKDEEIRRKKSELLYKFNSLNTQNKFKTLSSLRLSMDNSLEEIKNELDRIYNQKTTEDAVVWFKKLLIISAQGMEFLNARYDPINVDLNGWSENLQYSLDTNDLDETLAELYHKYRFSSSMSPELKLLFYFFSSAGIFAFNKVLSNNPEMLANVLQNFMNKSQQFPPQFQQPQQPQYQQQPQFQQQQFQQPQFQQPQFQQQQFQQHHIPNAGNLNKRFEFNESSDDYLPSKMKGPGKDKELKDILNKMDDNKIKILSESSDDIPKDINIKKRGRKPTKKQIIKQS